MMLPEMAALPSLLYSKLDSTVFFFSEGQNTSIPPSVAVNIPFYGN